MNTLCACVDNTAYDLCYILHDYNVNAYIEISKHNYGLASVLYKFITGKDIYVEERKKYLTYIITFASLNKVYGDYIFPFYWLSDKKYSCLHPIISSDIAYIVLSYIENDLGFMEHGSSIRGNWLINDFEKDENTIYRDYIDHDLAEQILDNLRKNNCGYK